MLLDSEQFGLIEIPEGEIITFPQGLYGFEQIKRYVLLGKTGGDNPFMWLHSVDDPTLCFVVIDPVTFIESYSPEIGEDTFEMLETRNFADLRFLSIVVVPDDLKLMTANLKSPVIINSVRNIAIQIILEDERFSFKHYILDMEKKGA